MFVRNAGVVAVVLLEVLGVKSWIGRMDRMMERLDSGRKREVVESEEGELDLEKGLIPEVVEADRVVDEKEGLKMAEVEVSEDTKPATT